MSMDQVFLQKSKSQMSVSKYFCIVLVLPYCIGRGDWGLNKFILLLSLLSCFLWLLSSMKMAHLKEFRTVKRNPRVSEKVSEVNCQGVPLPPGSQSKSPWASCVARNEDYNGSKGARSYHVRKRKKRRYLMSKNSGIHWLHLQTSHSISWNHSME